jgi:hypothetical protein
LDIRNWYEILAFHIGGYRKLDLKTTFV